MTLTTPAKGQPQQESRWWIDGLDGWRTLAVSAVLIFHLRPGTLPGGFIGVDVFFVISGFLITTLLVRELARHGRINLARFWLRRARRLLPALVTVVVTSTVAAYFAGGDLLVGIGRHIVGALTFSNNWVEIVAGSDYFAASTPNLFMNFWSLAVEEQFYILWPIITIVIMAFLPRTKHRLILLGGAAAISALAMAIAYTPGEETRVYYGTDTHAFGLLVGAGLAFAMNSPEIRFFSTQRWNRMRVPLALVGLGVVIGLMLTLNGDNPWTYRGGLALASLASASMVAALPGKPTALTKVLTLKPVEWVGVRSYGIYMWHWPAILIVEAAWPAAVPDSVSWWISRAVALSATVLLAAWSFTYVENPIRTRGFRAVWAEGVRWFVAIPVRGRAIVGTASLSVATVFILAIVTAPSQSTLEEAMRQAESYVGGDSVQTQETTTRLRPGDSLVVKPEEIYGVGDSMMYVAAPGLSEAFPGMTINAESNRQWPHIHDAVKHAVEVDQIGPVVVLAGGTNAGINDAQAVTDTIELLGPDRRIVLVNVYSSSTFVPRTNEVFDQVASQHPNVAVADWYETARTHPEVLQPDKVHPNMDGMHMWAHAVNDALDQIKVEVAHDTE